jgi:hypothetical protein
MVVSAFLKQQYGACLRTVLKGSRTLRRAAVARHPMCADSDGDPNEPPATAWPSPVRFCPTSTARTGFA